MFSPLFLVHRIWRKRIFLAAFFLAIPFATSILAASSSSLKVSAQTQESFSRLSFDWTKAISYTLKTQAENNTVHLRFKKNPFAQTIA